jgi:DNA-binding MarR family transcriptional regulator
MKHKPIDHYYEQGDLGHITTYQVGVLQASINRILQKHSDAILKPYGISKMQWLIIGTVLDSGERGIRLTDLAKILDTTMSYITTAVNLLESKDMLSRQENEHDSRSKFITINSNFKDTCDDIEHVMRESLRNTIYTQIDPAEFRVYIKVLHQLSKVQNTNS